MHRKLFPKSKAVRRLPSIESDSSNVTPKPPSMITSPVSGAGFRIRKYLTDKQDTASKKLNYLSPIKKSRVSSSKKGKEKKPQKTNDDPTTSETTLPVLDMTSEVAAEESNQQHDDELGLEVPQVEDSVPDSILLHKGNKLFWRINRTIDFKVYSSCGAIIVRSFDSGCNREFDPIVLEWDRVVSQVKAAEASLSSYQEELSKHTEKQVESCAREDDDIIKQIKRKKRAENQKKAYSMTAEDKKLEEEKREQELEVERMKDLHAMRAKVVAFVIARFEATKEKVTGEIKTCITKRPSDASTPLEFDEGCVPVGVAHVGEDDSDWNKKECSSAIRRKSTEVVFGLDEANQATRKASETQKAIHSALDMVKMLSDRQRMNSLPAYHQKFKKVVRKALFQGRLQKMQGTLAESETYKRFTQSSTTSANQ